MQWIFLMVLGLCWPGSSATQDSDAHQKLWVAPYNFSLDSSSHQLHTSWEVKGASVSFLCAFADFALVEIGFTGKEQELGDKMIVDVDITKYRVQPFKSYKVCISLEDPTSGSFLRQVCTHLFSFERAVPYVPTVRKVTKAVSAKLSTEREKNTVSEDVRDVEEKSEKETREKEEERRGLDLQKVLEDTRNFVRDDFSKVERALEEPFYNRAADFQSPFGVFLALGVLQAVL